MYRISSVGLELIKDFEKFEPNAYLDAKKVPTIGYGTTRINGVPVRLGMGPISETQATEYLHADVARFERRLNSSVTVELTQNQVDSLLDFMYNVGESGWMRSSLRSYINSRRPVFQSLFTRWNKIRHPETGKLIPLAGLTRRREAEYLLFIS